MENGLWKFHIRDSFMGRYEKWNKALAKDYLNQEEPLFNMKRKEGERWTPNNRFMYEDMVRFFGGVVIRQQRHIEELEKEIKNKLEVIDVLHLEGIEEDNLVYARIITYKDDKDLGFYRYP